MTRNPFNLVFVTPAPIDFSRASEAFPGSGPTTRAFATLRFAVARSLNFLTLPLWELILGSVVIVVLLAALGEGLSRIVRRLGKRAGLKDTTLVSIRDVIRALWIVLAVVGVAYYTDLTSYLTVLVVSTVGGLILSLALQATLSNVIAGLFMIEDGTLRVGDEVTYSGIKGKVIRMTLRTSWILNEKGSITVVSNSNLMAGPLTIHSGTPRVVSRYHLEGVVPPLTAREVPAEKVTEPRPEPTAERAHERDAAKIPERRARKGASKETTRSGP